MYINTNPGPAEELPEYDSVVVHSGPTEETVDGGAVYNLPGANKDVEAAREDALISKAMLTLIREIRILTI